MRQQQQCKNCKNHFADDAPQKDYKLYANYGFANEEQFKSHNSKNKHCPCKLNITENAIEEYNSGGNITSMLGTFATTVAVAAVALSNAPIPDVEWGPYIQGIMMSDEDNTAGVGDRVRIMETRPLSATKRWRVVEIIEKAK